MAWISFAQIANSHNNGIPINNSTGHITGEITIKTLISTKGNYFISMSIVDSETNNIIIWDHLFHTDQNCGIILWGSIHPACWRLE